MNSYMKLIRIVERREGQILPWVALLMILFAGFTSFVIDIGRGIIAYHMLQASCDSAAMAGVQLMSDTTQSSTAVTNQATLYSSVPGNHNANSSMLPNAAMLSGYPKVYCSNMGLANGVPCVAAGGTANAITVAQTVTLPTMFGGFVGIRHFTLSAASSALMAGAAAQKYNIAIVLDTTQSMTNPDPGGCTGYGKSSPTKIQCALLGVQTLLDGLQPCTSTSTSSNCTAFDGVSIFRFRTSRRIRPVRIRRATVVLRPRYHTQRPPPAPPGRIQPGQVQQRPIRSPAVAPTVIRATGVRITRRLVQRVHTIAIPVWPSPRVT